MKFSKEDSVLLALLGILLVIILFPFKRDESLISEEGREMLNNPEDREKIKNAIRNNKSTVQTSKGLLHL